jgi:hypothetical protein
MRELAEFNKVETTTHATVGIQGLAGLNMQQRLFSDEQRKQAIDEIKRAIHFAAEATTGGAVVFHTGEAPRSMLSEFQEKGQPLFEMHPEEATREQFLLADPVTKKIIPVKRDDRIAIPYIEKENGGYKYLRDENGEYVVDKTLEKYDPIHKGRIPIYETEPDGSIKVEVKSFNDWIKIRRKEYKQSGLKVPELKELVKDFYRVQAINQVQYYINFGRFSEGEYERLLDDRKKIIKSLNYYKDLKKKMPEEDWWKVKKTSPRAVDGGMFVPPEVEDPIEWLEERLGQFDTQINRQTEFDIMGKRQSLETLDMVNRSMNASDFAVEESAKSMAELGEYLWQQNEAAKKKYKKGELKGVKNDLYLAPENLFPETYGSHPDELKKMVTTGRKAMSERLVSHYGMSKGRAQELAEKHIKATFDIGHANIWRKYFVAKDGESLENRDKRFNKWLLGKTKELLNEGIIGHIHVSDNFGFHDEHLTAGDGNTPIKEFIEQAKKEGLSEFIIESGSFNPMTSLPDTWLHFDSPVYNIHVPGFTQSWWTEPSLGATPQGFSNFYRSYFGRTEGPRYIVGDYAPSEDFKGAPFYTGIPID